MMVRGDAKNFVTHILTQDKRRRVKIWTLVTSALHRTLHKTNDDERKKGKNNPSSPLPKTALHS